MNKLTVLTACIFIALVAFWAIMPVGCATIIPPAGGPRDTIPPRLLIADPPDSNVNFSGDRIVLTFDEYIDLKDVFNNLFFTPTFEINPRIAVRGKTIVIPFEEDALTPNTTYVLDFNNAIVDMNETNVLPDFTYTFSTGPVLDSLEISGRVILAQTGGVDSTLLAVLYRDLNDSAVFNKRAPYVTKLDREGYFTFRYLPSDSFAIYAIGGTAKDRRYMDEKVLFAFADQPVIAGQTDSLVLYAYNTPPPAKTTQPTRRPATDTILGYTINTSGQQDLLKDLTINFPVPLASFDSTRVILAADSSFNPVDYSISLDTSAKLITIQTQWIDSTIYHLILQKGFATDTAGRELAATDTVSFITRQQSDYGSLTIRFRNLDFSRQPVLQFVQNNVVVHSGTLTGEIFNSNMFQPGEYNLRILYDQNGDGKWTPGNFYGEKRQPEIVQPIERTITIKANWKNEFEIPL